MYIFKIFILGINYIFKFLISFIKYFFIGLFNIITIIPNYLINKIITISNKNKKSPSENKKSSFFILCLSVCIYLICVFIISRWYVQGLKIEYLSNDIISSTEIIENEENNNEENNNIDNKEETENNEQIEPDNTEGPNTQNNTTYYPNDYWDYLSVPFMNVDFSELLAKNSDTVGWIKVEGTKVNYPVVQASDNDYYLKHAFNKSRNAGGWIFADYRVNFKDFGKNTIIYGHNMNNKTMFGSISSMLNYSYFANSDKYFVKISTPTSNTVWKVFSIYTINPEVYYLKTNFKSESFETFINTLKERSVYDFGIEVSANDKVLTLSTCNSNGTKRLAVHAKMISIEYK